MSAFVEIILDNTDGRFPAEGTEVKIRRTVGVKKDEYSINNKIANRQELLNSLESAGFSRANPYYIVPQGRITALTNAKEAERLKVLKDVAGTEVYDDKKKDSMVILEQTESSRQKIRETLSQINQRLEELKDEKDELVAYQKLETEKRSLDHVIYDRELQSVSSHLDKLERNNYDGKGIVERQSETFLQLESRLAEIDEEVSKLNERVQVLKNDKKDLEEDLSEIITSRAKAELRYSELQENKARSLELRLERQQEAQILNDTISKKENELSTILPQYNGLRDQEQTLREKVAVLEGRQHRLEVKRGQNSRFSSKAQRDNWLNTEIADVEQAIQARSTAVHDLETEISSLEEQVSSISSEVASNRSELDDVTKNHRGSRQNVTDAELKKDQLIDERKVLWREESRADIAVDNARQKLEKAQQHLSETMSRDTYLGLKAVRDIAEKQNIAGYYGTLADVITVSDAFKLAVERTAGTSLFHVIVEDDETATKILKELKNRKGGRVTFMPLNRLERQQYHYPEAAGETTPLMKQVEFEPKFVAAVEQVFGKMLVCGSLELCRQYMHSHKLNTITIEGDRVDIKGVMTGGYHNPKNSRVDALRNVDTLTKELDKLEQEARRIKNNITIKDQEVTRALNEIARISNGNQDVQQRARILEDSIRSLVIESGRLKDLLDSKREDLIERRTNLKSLNDQHDSYINDLKSPFHDSLADLENRELERITNELRQFKREFQDVISTRSTVEQSKSQLESELHGNLYVRRDQLKANRMEFLDDDSHESDDADTDNLLRDALAQVQSLARRKDTMEKKLVKVEAEIDGAIQEKYHHLSIREKLEQEQTKLAQSIEQHQKDAERGVAKRALLQSRKEALNAKIRSLGTLPESVGELTQMESKDIMSRQKEVNDQLKKYTHINKRAAEQYRDSIEKRTHLVIREQELTNALDSIQDLIKTLDMRKDEAIDTTFKQVDREFSAVFQRLVPDGKGKLVFQKRDRVNPDTGEKIRETVGIDIDVSFNSRNNEQQNVAQLSGGQKSLCALALIFAIQRCDPAPFYLFDEIDANLDTQYRTAVAQMLKEQSRNAQYLCTTFRPEMVTVADKFYGVIYKDRMSSLVSISRDDAMSFIESSAR